MFAFVMAMLKFPGNAGLPTGSWVPRMSPVYGCADFFAASSFAHSIFFSSTAFADG